MASKECPAADKRPNCPFHPDCNIQCLLKKTSCYPLIEEVVTMQRKVKQQPCNVPCCSPSPPCDPCPSPRPSPPCPRQSPSVCAQRASSIKSQPFPCSLPVSCEKIYSQQYGRVSEGITTEALPADQIRVMELHYTEIPDEYIYTRDITPRTPIQPIYQYRRRYTPVQTPAELFSFIAPEYSFTPSPQLPPGVSPGPYRLRPIRIDPEQLLPPHEGSYMAYAPTRAIRQRRANQMTILPFSAELSYISFGQPTSVTLPIPPRPSFTPPLFSYTICQAPFGPEIPLPQVSTPIRSRIPPLQFRSPAMTQYSPSQSVCISQDISSSPVIQRRCYISTSTSSSPSPIIQRRFLISSSESTSDSVPSSNICSERFSSSPVIQRRGYISTSTSDSSRDNNSGRLSSSPIIQRRVPLDTSSSLETDSSSVSPIIRRPCFEIYESPGVLTPSQMHESLMSTSESYVPRATANQASMGSPYFSDTFYTAKPESPQLPFRVAPIQFRTPDSAIVSPHIPHPFTPPQMSTPIGSASPPRFL